MSQLPHIILGIKYDATKIQITNAYYNLAKKYHPDKYKGSSEYANRQFTIIKTAKDEMLNTNYKQKIINQTTNRSFNNVPNRSFNNISNRANINVLNNGTVLFSGNFKPSQLTVELLNKLKNKN
jgi:DnaJ-class molecular chaperone